MPTLFTRIIDGELPGTFVWRDSEVVAFLSIQPVVAGHTLVVPRAEVDHWIDLDPGLSAHVFDVARTIGRAHADAFPGTRVGLLIAGLEVPHAHVHVIPINSEADLHLSRAPAPVDAARLDAPAEAIRAALRARGASGVSV